MSQVSENPGAEAATMVNHEPVAQQSWRDSLPDDLKEVQTLTKFNDVASLARGYVNAEQLIGRDKIPMPRTDDEYIQVYRRLGAPEAIDGYTLDPKNFEQYGQGALDDLQAFKQMALDAGLTDKQATKLFNAYVSNVSNTLHNAEVEFEVAKQAAKDTLIQKYGKGYETLMQNANKALAYLASPGLIAQIGESGLGNNVEFIEMFAEVSKKFVEERGIDKSQGNQISVAQLNEELAKLTSHPAYFDGSHPEHALIVQKAQRIFEQMAQSNG